MLAKEFVAPECAESTLVNDNDSSERSGVAIIVVNTSFDFAPRRNELKK